MSIAIISDIHANIEALEAVLDDLDKRGVDTVFCLGDIVGYGPNPRECIKKLQQRIQKREVEVRSTTIERQGKRVTGQRISYSDAYLPPIVKGNHEEGVTNQLFCGDKYEFSTRARETLVWTKSILTPDEKEWLKELPYSMTVLPYKEGGRRILLAHAEWTLPQEFNYLIADDNDTLGSENMMSIGDNALLFCGHTHEQAIHLKDGWTVPSEEHGWEYSIRGEQRVVVNPGSVGQPRVAQHGKASYAIYDPETERITFHNIIYGSEITMRKIMELPNPPVTMKTKQELVERLRVGV